jgi:Glycosyl hydrolases family 39
MSRGLRSWRGAVGAFAVMTILSGCGGAAATPKPTPTPVPTAAPTPTPGLFVDAGSDQGAINPNVYGTNFGPWLSVPLELQPQVEAAGLKTITFPGGNWGDENDLTTDQLDQFIAYCKKLGAAPRVVVRLKNGTAAAAADLVKYANVTMKYGIKYWAVGNETDLYEANGLTGYTVDQYSADWRTFAKAMKAVDSTIILIGPDVSQFVANPPDTYNQARVAWLSSFLKTNGDVVDMVSVHRYPFPKDTATPPTADDLRVGGREWDQSIPALRSLIKEQTGKDLPVAVTEINSSWATNAGTDGSMDSHMNAIWFADVMGTFINQKVDMVDQFALASDWGIIGKNHVNPIYYDYIMFQHFGTRLVRSVSDDALVRVYAAKRADGAVTVMIVNLGAASATKPLTVVGGGSSTSAETWLFDATHSAEKVDATPVSAGGTVTVPGESVTVLVLAK